MNGKVNEAVSLSLWERCSWAQRGRQSRGGPASATSFPATALRSLSSVALSSAQVHGFYHMAGEAAIVDTFPARRLASVDLGAVLASCSTICWT